MLNYRGGYDNLAIAIDVFMGQLIVVPFLFFSGYGIMYQICKKGSEYIESIPKSRIFKVWIQFVFAILLFLLVDICIGNYYSPLKIIVAFFAWTDIGNSNWYIFAMLSLYFFTYIAFKFIRNNKIHSVIFLIFMCCVYIVVLTYSRKGSHWYNTILVYPAGMMYQLYKKQIEAVLQKNNVRYCVGVLLTILVLGLLCMVHLGIFNGGVWYSDDFFYQIFSIFFILTIVILSMKISVNNKILRLLGKYTFEIYILQRIPLMIFSRMIDNDYILFCVSLVTTLILAMLFKWFINHITFFHLVINKK